MSNLSYSVSDLNRITGGALEAETAAQRAERIQAWLGSAPTPELLQAVYKELLHKDQGTSKLLRERLDALKSADDLAAAQQHWQSLGQAVLDAPKSGMADLLAWQRDAQAAGVDIRAPELHAVANAIASQIKTIDGLEHQAQVQREAAKLLRDRLDRCSAQTWLEAEADSPTLAKDVVAWHSQSAALQADTNWPRCDGKYSVQLQEAASQLHLVADAFAAAQEQTRAALADSSLPLPSVPPVWLEAIKQNRLAGSADEVAPAARPAAIDPALRQAAQMAVQAVLSTLEAELEQGHGKASVTAANAVRQALKEHGAALDAKTDMAAQAALAAAAELEGWQRWRANQLRNELIVQAQALVAKPLQPKKQQAALKALRDAWKETDTGGMPNHALWARFDSACTQAFGVVDAWRKEQRAVEAASKTEREALLQELSDWHAAHANSQDWRKISNDLRSLELRWRDAGHMSDRSFHPFNERWKERLKPAKAALFSAQKTALRQRQALIAEAKALAAQQPLDINAVKDLQARWQAEAKNSFLSRKLEQQLWQDFRTPIDAAFQQKSQQREQERAAINEHEAAILAASRALEAASASGDASAIAAAMQALRTARLGSPAEPAKDSANTANNPEHGAQSEAASAAEAATDEVENAEAAAETAAANPEPSERPTVAPKPLIAMRGDDRPDAKKQDQGLQAAQQRAHAKPGRGERSRLERQDRPERDGSRGPRRGERDSLPRLSGAVLHATRKAEEAAQMALRKLQQQAHGAVLLQLIDSWQSRDAQALPAAAELGRSVKAATHKAWQASLSASPTAPAQASTALLRLELAADVPTPAEHLNAKRQLQLQLLTQKNAAGPAETWAEDVAIVLASSHDASAARRLQAVLGKLLRTAASR